MALLVEIAVSSVANDRGTKREVYATAGIPVYWVVNVKERQIEVYSEPQPGAYGSQRIYQTALSVPIIIDGNQLGEIAVNDILPSPAPSIGE